MVAIRGELTSRKLPLGKIRVHTGTCKCRDVPSDAARRVGVLVELDLGDGIKVSREYGHEAEIKS